ncbi:MAG: dienelactone hydrolase family protein [Myxococcales bacterium]|nr:dienelactone hydrolase family protein [Myxococcales bacterium]
MDEALLPCVEVGPREGARASVVWMHGLGADGHDFAPIVPALQLPRVRFVFPHAPALPVTINGGFVMPAWYDIVSLTHTGARENSDHIRASARRIVALVERERARGTPADKIVIAGFSQGGAMALHVGLRYPEALAGVLVLSAYHLLPETYLAERSEANRRAPIFFGHGALDPLVPSYLGRAAHDQIVAADAPGTRDVSWREYRMEHAVCPEEIADIAVWLRRVLEPAAAG